MKNKYYIGLKSGDRHLFKSFTNPTQNNYGGIYNAVIGPFKTKRGAIFMLEHGVNNPHCRCVADAERLSK